MINIFLKACFLTSSIDFLTPELALFKKNLEIHQSISCDIYEMDRGYALNELKENIAQYDIFIVDTWVTLLDSQFNTGNFRNNHLYKYAFDNGKKQLDIFRKWLLSIMQKELKSKLFILYAGAFDYWRIHQNDLNMIDFLINLPNFILWAPNPKFSSAKEIIDPYKQLVTKAHNNRKYLEIRHAIDSNYDVFGNNINKVYRIGVLPSLSKERIVLYKSIEDMMCPESRNLYIKSIRLLQDYRQRLAKQIESGSLSEIDIIQSKQRELNDVYRRILSLSKIICTTPTRYGSFIRKYLEVPYAKGMIASTICCGWEETIFRTTDYPIINMKKIKEMIGENDLSQIYARNEKNMINLQQNIHHFSSYEYRIDELVSYCLKY